MRLGRGETPVSAEGARAIRRGLPIYRRRCLSETPHVARCRHRYGLNRQQFFRVPHITAVTAQVVECRVRLVPNPRPLSRLRNDHTRSSAVPWAGLLRSTPHLLRHPAKCSSTVPGGRRAERSAGPLVYDYDADHTAISAITRWATLRHDFCACFFRLVRSRLTGGRHLHEPLVSFRRCPFVFFLGEFFCFFFFFFFFFLFFFFCFFLFFFFFFFFFFSFFFF